MITVAEGTRVSACAVGRAAEGTGLRLGWFGLVVGWVALILGSTRAFVAMCPACFWDGGQGAAGTLCTHALKGALGEYRGITDRARLAL